MMLALEISAKVIRNGCLSATRTKWLPAKHLWDDPKVKVDCDGSGVSRDKWRLSNKESDNTSTNVDDNNNNNISNDNGNHIHNYNNYENDSHDNSNDCNDRVTTTLLTATTLTATLSKIMTMTSTLTTPASLTTSGQIREGSQRMTPGKAQQRFLLVVATKVEKLDFASLSSCGVARLLSSSVARKTILISSRDQELLTDIQSHRLDFRESAFSNLQRSFSERNSI